MAASGNPNLCSPYNRKFRILENPSWWDSPFCQGQGQPGPGVYFSHSLQEQTLHDDPLADLPWSLAGHWLNIVHNNIPTADPDAAIQSVIAEIHGGLPVNLGFNSAPSQTATGPNGETSTLVSWPDTTSSATWYLPPELAGCTASQLDAVVGRTGGHSVNIVGYWITGTAAAPDPVTSYFILENNWGKDLGYRSFFFMNFAAFRYLANQLQTFRIDRTCFSAACATQPSFVFPGELRAQLLYPPDPTAPGAKRYQALIGLARAALSGVARGILARPT